MKKSLIHCLSTAALLALPLSTARANLVLAAENTISGTGIGTVNTILTITSQGNAIDEQGCIAFNGTMGSVFGPTVAGSNSCIGSDDDVQTGASQTQTRTLLQTGVTSAANFGIVFNAAEPGGNSVTVDDLTVTFYSVGGTVLYQASTDQSYEFDETNTGTGNSGFLFVLDATQQAEATAAGVFLNSGNVIGLAASVTDATGGQETFFVANTGGGMAVVPEPSTYALMAAGLLGVFGFARRRRQA